MQQHHEGLNERRSSVRIKTDVRIYYSAFQSKLLSDYSVDLSTGGLFLITSYPFDTDDNITLRFPIPGPEKKTVSCKAKVAWVNNETNRLKPEYPQGVGLQFVDLASEDLLSIEDFLEVEATS
jgi:uncharacterized protein (TIGR02266 family)